MSFIHMCIFKFAPPPGLPHRERAGDGGGGGELPGRRLAAVGRAAKVARGRGGGGGDSESPSRVIAVRILL